MLSKDIESIINLQPVFDLGGIIAGDATNNAEDDSRPGGNESRGRGDSNETSDSAGAETDSGPLLIETVIENTPGDSSNRCGNVSDDASHDRAHVSSEGATTVEAEPSNPEEHDTEDNVGHIVRTVWKTASVVVSRALTKHQAVCEGCRTRGDVDGSSTSEIETAQLEDPSRGIPGPASNWIVDDGRPDEDEDNAGEQAASVSCGADGESGTI